MPSCLGMYIENNIIKYAKLNRDHDNVKVEAFGIKFYENAEETIKQIINETYSYKVPISTNLSEEKYSYSELFSLLNKKDLEKAVDLEFDYLCNEIKKNRAALEYRRILTKNLDDKDKTTVIYSYTDKANILTKLQMLDGLKVTSMTPLAVSISTLNNNKTKNIAIVNIEKDTTITTIVNGEIYRINKTDIGMKEVLDKISNKENSYSKAYEVCKNTTIYTMEGKNLQVGENEYIEDIMPTLYSIIQEVKKEINSNSVTIEGIYVTGLGAVINNIDLYFQENFPDKKCEVLVPYFINKANLQLNIKDYIEVNSAIALALQGLGEGVKNFNFNKESVGKQLGSLLTMEIGGSKSSENKFDFSKIKNALKIGEGPKLIRLEKNMIRIASALLILVIVYTCFSTLTNNKINDKNEQIIATTQDTQGKIQTVNNYQKQLSDKTSEYETLVTKLEQSSEKLTAQYASKNSIPNLLTNIMFYVPKEVQITSISNTSGKHIKIEAQSAKYEQLAFLKGKLISENVLINIISNSGTKENDVVKVTIEGDLPY